MGDQQTTASGPNSTLWLFLWSFIRTQPRPFVCVLSMVASMLQRQSEVAAAERVWPAKPKILTVWNEWMNEQMEDPMNEDRLL